MARWLLRSPACPCKRQGREKTGAKLRARAQLRGNPALGQSHLRKGRSLDSEDGTDIFLSI
nr:hypothetical protein [uncultured bacterium]